MLESLTLDEKLHCCLLFVLVRVTAFHHMIAKHFNFTGVAPPLTPPPTALRREGGEAPCKKSIRNTKHKTQNINT